MDNVIDLSGFAPAASSSAEALCWLCQRGNTLRAFFCQHCGTIQPVRPIDHFARLGIDHRIDIDLELLDRQYTNLQRTFSAERFAIRGLGERHHAAKQTEALEEAYTTLRDPLRRGRYWLTLHEKTFEAPEKANPLVSDLRGDLEKAESAAQCDRIAQKAGQALEQGIVGLMQALRAQSWTLASAMLAEVEELETLLNDIRSFRQKLADGQTTETVWPGTGT